MNMTPELRLQGLQHEDFFVRSKVLWVLSEETDPETDAARIAQAQIDLHGWKKAFEYPNRVAELPQHESTPSWILHRLSHLSPIPDPMEPVHLLRWLARIPLNFLPGDASKLEEWIQAQPAISPELLALRNPWETIRQRLSLEEKTEAECLLLLDQIVEHCLGMADFPQEPLEQAKLICARLARHSGNPGPKKLALEWLSGWEGDEKAQWKAGIAIALCGQLRLTEATPTLINMFDVDWDWWNEQIPAAIRNMRAESAIDAIFEGFDDLEWHGKLFLSDLFSQLRWACKESRIAALLETESNEVIRQYLGRALAIHGTPSSMLKAHSVYLEDPDDPNYFEIAEILYANYCLLGGGNPREMQEWRARLETILKRQKSALEESGGPDFFFGQNPDPYNTQPSHPLVNPGPKIGRNDPCPCGSGKKYKKCCMP